MELAFRNLTLDDKKIFDKYSPHLHEPYGCEYCFPLIFIETIYDKTQICDVGDMAFIRTEWSGRRIFFPPLLKDTALLPLAIDIIEQACIHEGKPIEIRMVPEAMGKLINTEKYLVTENRSLADYIYKAEDLIHLAGKAFHSKRNFITRFHKEYSNHEFREYDEATDRGNIMKLLEKWETNTTHEKWATENKLIERALLFYRELDLKIAVLYVGVTLVAFSVNYIGNSDTAYTFFEKADTDYVGVYQTINQHTAEMFFTNTRLVNRQCDMNVEGLRKAKLSYHPFAILNKYKVQHKPDCDTN